MPCRCRTAPSWLTTRPSTTACWTISTRSIPISSKTSIRRTSSRTCSRAWSTKIANNHNHTGVKYTNENVAGKMPITELGVKAIDDKTLEVDLSKPVPYFVRMTTDATLFPVPQAVVEKFGQDWTKPENIVSNGAYTLAENSPGERVSLKRNPKYWDDKNTVLTTINFLTINDEIAGVTRYQAGEVDQTDVPAGQYPTMKAAQPDETHSVPQLCTYYFDINMTASQPVEALKDVRVREAISLAGDRDVIVI